MAGVQTLQDRVSPPGAFPETPLERGAEDNEAPAERGTESKETATEPSTENSDQSFFVNPIPASEGIGNPVSVPPGEGVPDSSTFNKNTVESTVHDDPELKSKDQEAGEQTFGVAPIPATGGIGNPVHLEPGEKVPDSSTLTGSTVDSTVKTDQDSYENSDSGAPVLPPALSPQSEREAAGASIFGPGPVIPESGMPMGEDAKDLSKEDMGPTVSSVGPDSTTAQLAGEQPIEPRGVPEVVRESQQEANADPEASANPEAVEEKSEMENEFMSKRPEEEPTSKAGEIAAGVGAAGVAAAGAAVAANEMIKDKTNQDPAAALPESVQKPLYSYSKESSLPQQATGGTSEEQAEPSRTEEPPKVEEPSKDTYGDKYGVGGEAAAGIGAAGVAAAGAGVAAHEMTKDKTGNDPASALTGVDDPARETTSKVPEEVLASQKEAGQDPEAAAISEAVQEKSEVENELLSKVKESDAQGEPAPTESAALATTAPGETAASSEAPQLGDPTAGVGALSMDDKTAEPSNQSAAAAPTDDGLNATKDTPAEPPSETATKASALAKESTPLDSRDVSPMSKQPTMNQTAPQVTTGTDSSKAPAESSATPRRNPTTGASSKKRQSWVNAFGTSDSKKSSSTAATPESKTDSTKKKKGFFGRFKDKLKS